MKQMVNVYTTIAVKAKNSIVNVPSPKVGVGEEYVNALDLELMNIGFRLSDDAKESLSKYTIEAFNIAVNILFKECTEKVGAHVVMRPLFPEFPNVLPHSEKINSRSLSVSKAVQEYLESLDDVSNVIDGDVVPTLSCGHQTIPSVSGKCGVCDGERIQTSTVNTGNIVSSLNSNRVINTVTKEDIFNYITNVLGSNSSVSESDLQNVSLYVENCTYNELLTVLPETIPFKENISFLSKLIINKLDRQQCFDILSRYVKTGKDVMRVAEDINESEKPKTFKLSNKSRKLVVSLLDNIKNPVEDMVKERDKWVQLNMALHFGSFKKKYPNAFNNVDRVLNKPQTIRTFESKLQESLDKKDVDTLVKLCSERPGIMGRNLDSFIRKFPDSVESILSTFESVGSSISARVLVTARNNFKSRINSFDGIRFYINKKGASESIESEREDIDVSVCDRVVKSIDKVLVEKLEQDGLRDKKVWIDPALFDFKVPIKMRSAKNALNKAERGSVRKVDVQDNILRLFTYWHEVDDRVDLDLSALIVDENFNQVAECAYYDIGNYVTIMRHSGDITSAPEGASEFIDINLDMARSHNGRYLISYVNSFTNQSFNEFEAFTGTMSLAKGQKSLFNPATVDDKFDLTSENKSVVTSVFDLKTNELVWADMSSHTVPASNMSRESSKIKNMVQYILNEKESAMSVGEYLTLGIKANNMVVVGEDETADILFDRQYMNNVEEFSKNWLG